MRNSKKAHRMEGDRERAAIPLGNDLAHAYVSCGALYRRGLYSIREEANSRKDR
jgi:hypothetical protein